MWTIQIRGDAWKDFVTKINSKEEAERLLPQVAAQFILPLSRYRIVQSEA